jgi:hypothetical protein
VELVLLVVVVFIVTGGGDFGIHEWWLSSWRLWWLRRL